MSRVNAARMGIMPNMLWRCFAVLVAISILSPVRAPAQDLSPVQVEHYTAPIRVACIGDSITAGFGAGRGNAWPAQLQKVLGALWEVRNFGVSGTTLMKSGDIREGGTELAVYHRATALGLVQGRL